MPVEKSEQPKVEEKSKEVKGPSIKELMAVQAKIRENVAKEQAKEAMEQLKALAGQK